MSNLTGISGLQDPRSDYLFELQPADATQADFVRPGVLIELGTLRGTHNPNHPPTLQSGWLPSYARKSALLTAMPVQ